MVLAKTPRPPPPDVFLTLGASTIPETWDPYLPRRARSADDALEPAA